MAQPEEDAGSPDPTPRYVVQLDVRSACWIFVGLMVAFGIFAIARNAAEMLTRLVIGLVLALALDGLVQGIRRRWGVSRSISVAIVGAGLFALALLVVLVLGPPAVRQASEFSREIPETVEAFYDLPLIGDALERNDAATKVQEWIDELPADISDEAIADIADRLVGGVFSIVVVVLTTFALLLDGDRIVDRGRRLVPPRYRDQADRIARTLHRSVGHYFGGSLTVAALMGLYVLAIGLAFNIPLAPLAAIWAMFTNLIPQVGGFLGGAFLFVLAVSNGVGTALVVVVLFVVYMNLENHVIAPAIVGHAVNLSPPTTMLAAFLGAAVAGVPGALIATPLFGAVKQLYLGFRFGDEEVSTRKRRTLFERVRARLRRGPGTDRAPDPA